MCELKDYHSYDVSPANFIKGKRCPYCKLLKVHPRDSFAQYHIDKTDPEFMTKYWSKSNTIDPFTIAPSINRFKVWINCVENPLHEEYDIVPLQFTKGSRCRFCSHWETHISDSIGILRPEVFQYWSDKNEDTPYDYTCQSGRSVYWKCNNNIHDDYKRTLSETVNKSYNCPECVRERDESFLSEYVRKYLLEELGYKLKFEHDCDLKCISPKTGYILPYDMQIYEPMIDLYLEIQGIQHFVPTNFSGKLSKQETLLKFKEQQYRDKLKKDFVLANGKNFLEIPYTAEKNDYYKILIDNKISEILSTNNINIPNINTA